MSKYHNIPVCIDGIWFDSTSEGNYYAQVLKPLVRAGKISDLQFQVPYELIPPVYVNEVVHLKTKDKTVKKCVQKPTHYLADFVYTDNSDGKTYVIDVKGVRTKEYMLKKKMMLAFKGIEIKEINMNKKRTTRAKVSRKPTGMLRPAISVHPKELSNGQPRPRRRVANAN